MLQLKFQVGRRMEFAGRRGIKGCETRSYINEDDNIREFFTINNDTQAGSPG